MYFVKIQMIFLTLGLLYSVIAASDVADHPNWKLIDRKNCGKNSLDGNMLRIIGGQPTRMGMYPWMARIGRPSKFNLKNVYYYCGGSLINKNYVLTAAHCIKLGHRQTSTVRLGEHDTTTDKDCENDKCAPPVQDFSPAKMIVHSKFAMTKMVEDIALIRLDRPAEFNTMVQPICLPDSAGITAKVGSFLKVAGWGIHLLIHSDRLTPILLDVSVEILPFKKCDKFSQYFKIFEEGQICAGGKVGYDSCAGDSGGPLMGEELVNGVNKYFLKGIVSFGDKECGSKNPALYTRVNNYIQWILDNITE